MTEEWRPVVGYEGLYEVSNHGRVRSFGRYRRGINDSKRFCPGRILTLILNKDGYPIVNLYASTDSTSKKTFRVHRIVADAFLCPAPDGKNEINHINGIKTDANATNLEWVSHAENQAHAGRIGLMAHGDSHPKTLLSTNEIHEVRVLQLQGLSQREIGERFGVSRHVIGFVLRGQTYKHVRRERQHNDR